ncbi:cytochrome c biogenesis protein ResB [Cytobacillus sp. IB215316]|uniref:cytochrome c biogenesis protein ResB n=1 Tax=Cytobacillus sp. IB215316 TaxID=3097354 RepID=UPI002A175D43|nr:cytochrome c biogenesis protein ResB [Cytobacillus sp. IB215316]MDX8362471.1 cytochrome c biogenesis protein ResB [Cytobacillus sp. IB215316]
MVGKLCECGEQNQVGTELCSRCGNPLNESATNLINMRYEGTARRSQVYNKTPIDKAWQFFSSVKVGVWLIILLLLASIIGTIFPQEIYIPPNIPPSDFYKQEYGVLGDVYYQLGFNNLYNSWWYLLLIGLLSISLTVASIDRVIPLYKQLKNQRVTKHVKFLEKQRLLGITYIVEKDVDYTHVLERLQSSRYTVRKDGDNFLAEKGRFSRWGPYVNHIGLIIVLFGGMLRYVPGFYLDEVVWLRDGETKEVPGTNGEYYIKNEKFILEFYDENDPKYKEAINNAGGVVPKNYQTNAILFMNTGSSIPGVEPDLEEIKREQIRVNYPLEIDNYALYQVSYKQNEFESFDFAVTDKASGESFGKFTVDLVNPITKYQINETMAVELMSYLPDYELGENGPITKSKVPNNPAFAFNVIGPNSSEDEVSFLSIGQNLEPLGENNYKIELAGVKTRNVTALTIRKDLTLGIIGLGGFIFMVGLVQGSYWQHRRIWLQRFGDELWVAGHTNKGWFSFQKELQKTFHNTGISVPIDQLEKRTRGKNGEEENVSAK